MEKQSKIGKTKVCKTAHKLCLYHLKLILSPKPKDHLLSTQLGRLSLYPPDQSTLRVERMSSSLYARSTDIPLQWYLGQNFLTNSLVVEPLWKATPQADGHPIPNITWTRCTEDIPADRSEMEGGQLKINSLTAKDRGTYICSAQSEFVHVETEVQLIVKTGENYWL